MTHSDQSPLLKTSWEQVVAAVSAIDTSIGKWLTAQHNIGLTEYRALEHISASPMHELRITELAQKLGLNQSSVTRLVGRMDCNTHPNGLRSENSRNFEGCHPTIPSSRGPVLKLSFPKSWQINRLNTPLLLSEVIFI